MDKSKITNHLKREWHIYVIGLVAIGAIWYSLYTYLNQWPRTKVINITYFGDDIDITSLKEDLQANKTKITNQQIKEINTETVPSGGEYVLGIKLATTIQTSDLIFIEESLMYEKIGDQNFNEISSDKAQSLIAPNLTFYEEDGVKRGIQIFEAGWTNRFSSFYTGKERVFLFLPSFSPNMGTLYSDQANEYDAALKFAGFLLQ